MSLQYQKVSVHHYTDGHTATERATARRDRIAIRKPLLRDSATTRHCYNCRDYVGFGLVARSLRWVEFFDFCVRQGTCRAPDTDPTAALRASEEQHSPLDSWATESQRRRTAHQTWRGSPFAEPPLPISRALSPRANGRIPECWERAETRVPHLFSSSLFSSLARTACCDGCTGRSSPRRSVLPSAEFVLAVVVVLVIVIVVLPAVVAVRVAI